MLPIEEYLERRGAKYFVTVLMLFYVLGTVIFNVYLRSIGLYEFALLQLRYMFIGFTFGLITITVPLFLLLIRRMIWGKGEDWTKKEKAERARIQNKIEKVVLIIFIPWIFIYALYIFPLISPGFGGGQPIEARLVGDRDQIKKINTIIARETGVDSLTLPYELLDEDSGLAIGTNVQILDQSKDRYLLLLTKDLYLSSQSQVAKKLIEDGDGESIDIEGTQNFKNKPLPISSKGIETITLDLYEPPTILTKTDLEVAAATIAAREGATEAVSDILESVQPENAKEVLVAVKKTVQEAKKATLTTPKKTSFTLARAVDPKSVGNALEIQYDTVWLDVRSTLFAASTRLQGIERSGENQVERMALVEQVSSLLQQHYSKEYTVLNTSEKGYLSVGKIYDTSFPSVLTKALRGAENVDSFIGRINALSFQAPERKPFEEIQSDIVRFFDISVLEQDTQTNRNYIQQKVTQYLRKEAPEQKAVWKDTKYIQEAQTQNGYSLNLKTAVETSTTWEELTGKLTVLYEGFLNSETEEVAPVEDVVISEPVVEIENDSTTIEEESVVDTPVIPEGEEEDPIEENPPVVTPEDVVNEDPSED